MYDVRETYLRRVTVHPFALQADATRAYYGRVNFWRSAGCIVELRGQTAVISIENGRRVGSLTLKPKAP